MEKRSGARADLRQRAHHNTDRADTDVRSDNRTEVSDHGFRYIGNALGQLFGYPVRTLSRAHVMHGYRHTTETGAFDCRIHQARKSFGGGTCFSPSTSLPSTRCRIGFMANAVPSSAAAVPIRPPLRN